MCFINAHFQNCQLYHSFALRVVCNKYATVSVYLFLAESGVPAKYAFDQLMDFLDPLHTLQDFCKPADEIVRLLMCPNVHSFFVTSPN